MSDPNWTSPSGAPAEPDQEQQHAQETAPAVPQQYIYAAIDPGQNWGVAVPHAPGYAILVPRPPRPPIVRFATILALVGAAIALIVETANVIYQWNHRAELFATFAADEQLSPDLRETTETATVIGLFVGLGIWILVAAGVVVCTVLVMKKKNAARIVLAALMGVTGLYQLCQVGSGAIVLAASDALTSASTSPLGVSLASVQITWWWMVGQVLLTVIALIVFVSLIIPPANRYFAPSPGHRFAPEV
jgi:hypothetical protein